jgi:hypothetical protein
MHIRPVAIAIGVSVALVAGAFLLAGSRPRIDPVGPVAIVDSPMLGGLRFHVPPEQPRAGSFGEARPCLIDTVSCLELAPGPFAPCLLAVERCSGEWRLHPLVGRNAH